MQKVVYIIPGCGESSKKQPSYNKVAKLFNAYKIHPIHVQINWRTDQFRKKSLDFNKYCEDFIGQFKKTKNTKTYVLGFSFGSIIGLLTASKIKPNVLILCSLSPYFKQDLKKIPLSWRKWWYKAFINPDFDFSPVAKKIKSKTYILAGNKEGPEVAKRARGARKKIKNSQLVFIKNAKHNLNQKEYLKAIENLISIL